MNKETFLNIIGALYDAVETAQSTVRVVPPDDLKTTTEPTHPIGDECRLKEPDMLTNEGHNVVDTYDESFREMEGKNTALLSLAKSLERMAECDAVYFCKGWRDARGCRAEFHVAKAYGLETWEEELRHNALPLPL